MYNSSFVFRQQSPEFDCQDYCACRVDSSQEKKQDACFRLLAWNFPGSVAISRMRITCFAGGFEMTWKLELDQMTASGTLLDQVLKASAGRKCCQSLIAWSKIQALNAQKSNETLCDERQWHMDQYEMAEKPNTKAM